MGELMTAHMAECSKIVLGFANEAISTSATDYVSMKNYDKVVFVVQATNAASSATGLMAIAQATAVDGTGAKALLVDVPYWKNIDWAAGSDLTKATATLGSITSDGVDSKEVVYVWEVKGSDLDVANGFDCVNLTWATTANVTATALILCMNAGISAATPPAAITD